MRRTTRRGLAAGVVVACGVATAAFAAPITEINGAATVTAPAERVTPPTTPPGTSPTLGGCSMFPADNPWNQRVDGLPLRSGSAQTIAAIQNSGGDNLHPDFGENPDYGIPYVIVPANQALVPIAFGDEADDESDPGPYPIPLDAPIEGNGEGDSHVLVLQQGSCKLYELYASERQGSGWFAYSGAVFDLSSNALRPLGWTSADAAGLPILPGLVRYDEVASGRIGHAIRVTFSSTQAGYILPATHEASSDTNPNLPPMGLRLRLRADYDTSGLHGQALVIATAFKEYGIIVADNGSNWFFQGAPSPGWNDDELEDLKGIPGTAFEVVETGPVHS
jgi:hypothetical protein